MRTRMNVLSSHGLGRSRFPRLKLQQCGRLADMLNCVMSKMNLVLVDERPSTLAYLNVNCTEKTEYVHPRMFLIAGVGTMFGLFARAFPKEQLQPARRASPPIITQSTSRNRGALQYCQ